MNLTSHALGVKLRRLRKANGLSLRQLADAAGTSASFLSQLERGLTGASTSTLMRIANCFDSSLSELFADAEATRSPVMRQGERPLLQMLDGQRKTLLSRRPLTQFEAYVSEFDPQGSTGPEAYTHGDSHEMLLVLAGTIRLELGPESHDMGAGDSIEYQSSTPHRVVNISKGRAEVLFVISPPTSTAAYLDGFKKALARSQAAEPQGHEQHASNKGRRP